MAKIPVWRTISQTYGYALARYLPNLGVIWLPFLIMGVIGYYYFLPALAVFPAMLNDIAQHRLQSPRTPYMPPGMMAALGRIFLFDFCVLLIFPVIAVGLTKEALGLRRGPRFVYLSIGKSELLVIGGYLTIFALYIGFVIAMAIIGGIAGSGQVDPTAVAATVVPIVRVVILLFYLVIVYFLVRLTFLLVPVSTVEGRLGPWRSWQLTKGNFWRIIAIILGTFLPLTILFYAIWFAVFGPDLFKFILAAQLHPGAANETLGPMMQEIVHYMVYGWAFGFVIAPVSYGLMFGQSAFAYRALVPPPADRQPEPG
jgi:hypothetical protein